MHPTLQRIKDRLQELSDETTQETFQRFFKDGVTCYGVKAPTVRKLAKEGFREVRALPKAEILSLCEQLYQSAFSEEAMIAATWAEWMGNSFVREDISLFERWIDSYVDDWAKCNTLCNHTVGSLIMKFPECLSSLVAWTASPNPFVRRAAAVTLIIPAKRGMFLKDIFHIATLLLLDQHDLVQKGYGWMLKEASRTHQEEVLSFVIQNKDRMPRTALRYAIEKMPTTLRKKAMCK